MSVKLVGQVWEYQFSRAEQAVMLAMADHANDDGGECFPSVGRIAWKTDYSERQVQRIIQGLVTREVLVLVRQGGRGRGAEYRIDLSKADAKPDFAPLKGDTTMSPYAVEKHDIATSPQDCAKGDTATSPQQTERVTFEGEKGDILPLKGDIAMAHEPITNNQLVLDHSGFSEIWGQVLADCRSTYPSNSPAHHWLENSHLVRATDAPGLPKYHVVISDPDGVDWLNNRMGIWFRRSLAIALRMPLHVEVVSDLAHAKAA